MGLLNYPSTGPIYAQTIETAIVQRQSFNVHPLKIDLDTNPIIRFGPVLEASVSLMLFGQGVQANAGVYLYSEVRGLLTYPAKNALTTTTVPKTVLPTVGNCFTPHYLELALDFNVNGTFAGTLLSKTYGWNNVQILHEPMVFGCFIGTSSVSKVETFSMRIANLVVSSAGSVAALLKNEFASFMRCDSSNLSINLDTTANFQVKVLDGNTTLATTLCNAIASTTSGLYSTVSPTYPTMLTLKGQATTDCSTI